MKAFEVEPEFAQHLLDLELPATFEIKPTQADNILRAVDYAWLSDLEPSKFHTASMIDFNSAVPDMSLFLGVTNGTPIFPMSEVDIGFRTPHALDTPFHELFNEV